MATWRAHFQQTYLNEMLWGEGLRLWTDKDCCSQCGTAPVYDSTASATDHAAAGFENGNAERAGADPTPSELYCCWQCGDFLECRECCIKRHASMPLHVVEVRGRIAWLETCFSPHYRDGMGASGPSAALRRWGLCTSSGTVGFPVWNRRIASVAWS